MLQDVAQQDYKAPQKAASILNQHYPPEARKHLRILDVGAGTGLVAEEVSFISSYENRVSMVKNLINITI